MCLEGLENWSEWGGSGRLLVAEGGLSEFEIVGDC
jgi:hypothetical protein